jgi:hypothetical protein
MRAYEIIAGSSSIDGLAVPDHLSAAEAATLPCE